MAPNSEVEVGMETETVYDHIDKYHSSRRAKLLSTHPELRSLMQVDPSFKYVAALSAITQLIVSYWLNDKPIWFVVLMGCFIGPLFNVSIANAIHEIVHDLAIDGSALANKVFGNFINFALAWPMSGEYYRTHRNHHAYLGSDLDVKYPTVEEALKYDQDVWSRVKFILNHPLAFGERWCDNLKEQLTDYMVWNSRTVYAFDVVILFVFGWKSLLYLLISFWMNDSVFILGSMNYLDHWVSDDGIPYTCSHYGMINLINYNIGYHREHHDMPNIPGRYLVLVYKYAKEHYDDERFIVKHMFLPIWNILTAEPGKGLYKHANKLPKPMRLN
jgi:sphingolipid delta-4 desaturase